MDHAEIPFESPKLLIARAKENIADFDARYKTYMESRPYEVVTEPEPKSPNKITKIRLTKQIDPMMRAVLSDALNNLRHALDQAVNDAAVLLRGGKRDCYFPFGQNAKAFELIYTSKRYKTVPIDIRDHLNSLQPYFGGDDLLHALGRLSGPNKHQVVLRIAAGAAHSVKPTIRSMVNCALIAPVWDAAKGELPVFRLFPGGYVECDLAFSPQVSLHEPSVQHLALANDFAEELVSLAERIVGGIERETYRLLGERENGHGSSPAAA